MLSQEERDTLFGALIRLQRKELRVKEVTDQAVGIQASLEAALHELREEQTKFDATFSMLGLLKRRVPQSIVKPTQYESDLDEIATVRTVSELRKDFGDVPMEGFVSLPITPPDKDEILF